MEVINETLHTSNYLKLYSWFFEDKLANNENLIANVTISYRYGTVTYIT